MKLHFLRGVRIGGEAFADGDEAEIEDPQLARFLIRSHKARAAEDEGQTPTASLAPAAPKKKAKKKKAKK